jgi:hypothetical protein
MRGCAPSRAASTTCTPLLVTPLLLTPLPFTPLSLLLRHAERLMSSHPIPSHATWQVRRVARQPIVRRAPSRLIWTRALEHGLPSPLTTTPLAALPMGPHLQHYPWDPTCSTTHVLRRWDTPLAARHTPHTTRHTLQMPHATLSTRHTPHSLRLRHQPASRDLTYHGPVSRFGIPRSCVYAREHSISKAASECVPLRCRCCRTRSPRRASPSAPSAHTGHALSTAVVPSSHCDVCIVCGAGPH